MRTLPSLRRLSRSAVTASARAMAAHFASYAPCGPRPSFFHPPHTPPPRSRPETRLSREPAPVGSPLSLPPAPPIWRQREMLAPSSVGPSSGRNISSTRPKYSLKWTIHCPTWRRLLLFSRLSVGRKPDSAITTPRLVVRKFPVIALPSGFSSFWRSCTGSSPPSLSGCPTTARPRACMSPYAKI